MLACYAGRRICSVGCSLFFVQANENFWKLSSANLVFADLVGRG